MSRVNYEIENGGVLPDAIGMIVLQTDETLEPEFKSYFADHAASMYISRIPNQTSVTPDTLSEMEVALPTAAGLLPNARTYSVVGYGCTSASAVIGSDKIEELVRRNCNAKTVTNPLRAAIAFAHHHGLKRLALLSPYIEEVNEPLRQVFRDAGLTTDTFGTFCESDDAQVARIAIQSVVEAAIELGRSENVDGVFISCTNLRTLEAIPEVERNLKKPVFSSNYALAWHMEKLAS